MKVSLKLDDQQQNNPILFKAKIPIAVFGLPFLSAVSATHHHSSAADNLSLSLRTHFPAGPSLKLSYNTPTTTPTVPTTATTSAAPFTVTLKSGVSLSGSPINSPLIISANFSFSPKDANPNPSFSIHFKPRLGSFSFRKSIASSVSNDGKKVNGVNGVNGTGGTGTENGEFVAVERTNIWKDFRVDSGGKDSLLSGILMVADTELPVTKRVKVNLRWGVSVPASYEKGLPFLRVNKIKVERVDVKEEGVDEKKGVEREFEVFKGMYAWMAGELSDLKKENGEMRRALEDMKSSKVFRDQSGYGGGGGKRAVLPVVESSAGFEEWRMKKKKGGGGGGSEANVESELQKAIKEAAAAAAAQ